MKGIIHTFMILCIASQVYAKSMPMQPNAESETSEKQKARSQTFKMPPIWHVKTSLKDSSRLWIESYSTIKDSNIDQDNVFDCAYMIYNIVRAGEKAYKNLKIENENELRWLTLLGYMLSDKWECDNKEDAMFRQRLINSYCHLIDELSNDKLNETIQWSIENKNHLKCNWLDDWNVEDNHIRAAYYNLMSSVIDKALDIQSTRGTKNPKAAEWAMMATFSDYDGKESTISFMKNHLDYRAIDIMLKWGDYEETTHIIKSHFDPSDNKKIINNLWIIETLMKYGYDDLAEELTLIGNDQTQSIILDMAIKEYSSASYVTQLELRSLIRHIQKFVLK
ncbi:MAG: hypothetical protein K2H60_12735 [Muribaculaceae bacterium]|nr:hypothetical protein [Muribaculaceae bacterium]